MMRQMEIWAESDNHHVRRLASEGCRPRLPWGMALPDFKQDPSPILPILQKLRLILSTWDNNVPFRIQAALEYSHL